MDRDWISLKEFQETFIGTTTAFVSYRLPGETEPETLMNPQGFITLSGYQEIFSQKKGFVMAPFQKSGPVLFLSATRSFRGIHFQKPDREVLPATVPLPDDFIRPLAKQEYIHSIEQVIEKIRAGRAKKVVLSRPILVAFEDPRLSASLFQLLCNDYPTAFVYLAWMPGYGLWMGATPEMLLNVEEGAVWGYALAGTRKAEETGAWGEKEIDEHEWVCRHIQEKLIAAGCTSIARYGTETVNAGKVSHLKTIFKAAAGEMDPAQLLDSLHPTPAVCGWPGHSALNIIREAEQYDRSFYTGFLGPVAPGERLNIFVNLRCMQITAQGAMIYSGGGITATSNAGAEWEETELKSRTLLNPIKKIQNFAVN